MNNATFKSLGLTAVFVVHMVACSPRESPKQASEDSNSRRASPSGQSGPIQTPSASVRVTKAEYGEDWPFTVDEGSWPARTSKVTRQLPLPRMESPTLSIRCPKEQRQEVIRNLLESWERYGQRIPEDPLLTNR